MSTQQAPSLQQELDRTAEQFATTVPESTQAVMRDAADNLEKTFDASAALGVGDHVADFTLPDATGRPFRLADALAEGPVVVTFYRGAWCPYCNLELRALQATLPEMQARGATLVAISPQTPDASLSTQEKNELAFPVLGDSGNEVARQFGIVFKLSEDLATAYDHFGVDLEESNGDASEELPVPATYVIDPSGEVRFAFVETDYRKRAEPAAILTALE